MLVMLSVSNYEGIEKALIGAYLSVDSVTPTGYPGAEMDDVNKPDGLWIQLHNIRAQSRPKTLGYSGRDNHPGFLQVDLNYPKSKGSNVLLEKADELAVFFIAGRSFFHEAQEVRITSTSLSGGRTVGGYYRMSLTIYYYARTSRN